MAVPRVGRASVVGDLGSQGHLSQVDEMKRVPLTAVEVITFLSTITPRSARVTTTFLLRDRIQHYLHTSVSGEAPLVAGLLIWTLDIR